MFYGTLKISFINGSIGMGNISCEKTLSGLLMGVDLRLIGYQTAAYTTGQRSVHCMSCKHNMKYWKVRYCKPIPNYLPYQPWV